MQVCVFAQMVRNVFSFHWGCCCCKTLIAVCSMTTYQWQWMPQRDFVFLPNVSLKVGDLFAVWKVAVPLPLLVPLYWRSMFGPFLWPASNSLPDYLQDLSCSFDSLHWNLKTFSFFVLLAYTAHERLCDDALYKSTIDIGRQCIYLPVQRYVKSETDQRHVLLFDLISKLLHYKPTHRLCLSEALRHPFFDWIQKIVDCLHWTNQLISGGSTLGVGGHRPTKSWLAPPQKK